MDQLLSGKPSRSGKHAHKRKEGPGEGPLEGVGYGGVSPREDKVNIALIGKREVNGRAIGVARADLEASPRIELGCTDLQSAA